MSKDFEETKQAIHEDIINPEYKELLTVDEETDTSILVCDMTDECFTQYYCITDTDVMDKDWLRGKIIVTPSLQRASTDVKGPWNNPVPFSDILNEIMTFLLDFVPKTAYQTLNRLILIYDDVEDEDYLSEVKIDGWHEDFDYLLEDHGGLPSDKLCGISWARDCVTIVNVRSIQQATEEMIRSGECSRENKGSDIMRGVLMTVAHEFRHLQQDNPYSDKTGMQPDRERDAEDFAIEHYENYECSKIFRNL